MKIVEETNLFTHINVKNYINSPFSMEYLYVKFLIRKNTRSAYVSISVDSEIVPIKILAIRKFEMQQQHFGLMGKSSRNPMD